MIDTKARVSQLHAMGIPRPQQIEMMRELMASAAKDLDAQAYEEYRAIYRRLTKQRGRKRRSKKKDQ